MLRSAVRFVLADGLAGREDPSRQAISRVLVPVDKGASTIRAGDERRSTD